MSKNIRILKTENDEISDEAIDLSNDILVRVTSGECIGLAVAMVMRNGDTWQKVTASTSRHALLAAILDLLMDYQRGSKP